LHRTYCSGVERGVRKVSLVNIEGSKASVENTQPFILIEIITTDCG